MNCYYLRRVIVHVPGGERDDACDHGLSRRSLRVKTSYELSWKVKVMIKKRKKEKKRY